MKNALISLSLALLVSFCSFSAIAEPIQEDVKKCVAYICKSDGSQITPIGTGFFVGYKYKSVQDKFYVFLVTARHVVMDDKGKIHPQLFLRMNDKETGRSADYKGIKNNFWFFHSNEQAVDIAVQPFLPKKAEYLWINNKDFITDQFVAERKIGIGDEIFYVGLLSYLSGKEKIAPIVRFGRLSLRTDEKTIDGKYYHFIDAGNIPGHSGSPVFLWATPERTTGVIVAGPRIFGLYGIVSGVLEYNKQLKVTIPRETVQRPTPIDARSGGITAVVPTKYLIEILESRNIKSALKIGQNN